MFFYEKLTFIRYVFGFPFNGDSMIMPETQKWQDNEIELSRRMIEARDSRTATIGGTY